MRKNLRVVACLWTLLCVACGAKPAQYPGYCYDNKAFETAILRCTDKSTTREQSRACRKATNESCGFTETVSKNAHE